MKIDPKPGLVIRYDFLWKEEEQAGHIEGKKDRPCAIILATKQNEDKTRDIILCPITHSPPKGHETAVEIPLKVSRHLKLDDDKSWIKTHQINTVKWHEDFAPLGVVPAHKNQQIFGQLPYLLGKQASEQVLTNSKKRILDNIKREDDNQYVKTYLAESRRQHIEGYKKQELTQSKDTTREKDSGGRER
ncbi:MAG: type II toxin-antitoxin system PemK/MazF family toxin [Pseudomonadales bacterium]